VLIGDLDEFNSSSPESITSKEHELLSWNGRTMDETIFNI
jgi:hypothetical protein